MIICHNYFVNYHWIALEFIKYWFCILEIKVENEIKIRVIWSKIVVLQVSIHIRKLICSCELKNIWRHKNLVGQKNSTPGNVILLHLIGSRFRVKRRELSKSRVEELLDVDRKRMDDQSNDKNHLFNEVWYQSYIKEWSCQFIINQLY